jgi:hypothetical protein
LWYTSEVDTVKIRWAISRATTLAGEDATPYSTALTRTTVVVSATSLIRDTDSVNTGLIRRTRIIRSTRAIDYAGEVYADEWRLTLAIATALTDKDTAA